MPPRQPSLTHGILVGEGVQKVILGPPSRKDLVESIGRGLPDPVDVVVEDHIEQRSDGRPVTEKSQCLSGGLPEPSASLSGQGVKQVL